MINVVKNLTEPTKKKCVTLSAMIQICADTGPLYVQGAALVAAVTQVICLQPKGKGKNKVNCFQCREEGHIAQNRSTATPVGTT